MKILTNKKYEELLDLCELDFSRFVREVLCVEEYSSFVDDGELINYVQENEYVLFRTSSFVIPNDNSKKSNELADRYNTRLLFKLFENISSHLANDPIFWTSIVLLNDSFREYTVKRWGLDKVESNDEKISSQSVIRRVFYLGTGANTKRNSAARLWWSAKLAYSRGRGFKYVDYLLQNNDLSIGLIERNWSNHRPYVRSILVSGFQLRWNTSDTRELFKYLSSIFSVMVVPKMDCNYLGQLIKDSKFCSDLDFEEFIVEVNSFDSTVDSLLTRIELINWSGEYITTTHQAVELIKKGEPTLNGFRYKDYEFVKSEIFIGDFCCKGNFGESLIINID